VNLCVGAPSSPIGENPKMDWGLINVLINNEFFFEFVSLVFAVFGWGF
jgi:hypothetical protein